jgi:beta-glucanase (GH16 family)
MSRIILLAALLVLVAGCSKQEEPLPEIGLIWSDEFEGPAGQLPDPQKWRFDIGTDWGNLQLEWDTDRPENVSLDGEGHLAITAREEEFSGQPYTSGRIKTQDLFERRYGRIEARIKVPVGQGIWPAFWMLGNDIDQISWPNCGEIDIMEYRGHEPRVLHGTIHGPGHAGDNSVGQRHELAQGGFHLGFHVFAVDWSADSIVWTVDDFAHHSVTPSDLPAGADWVYRHPFFILLNVAVGGRWPGSPNETTSFPQTMLVDWVRVYGEI